MRSTKNKIIVIISMLFLVGAVIGYFGNSQGSMYDTNAEIIPSEEDTNMPEIDTEVGALRVI